VVDVETTGLCAERDRILQIGAVILEVEPGSLNHRILETWSTEVKLRWPLQRVGPRHIHGLTRRQMWGAPPMQRVLADLNLRLSGSIFTAHNAPFDAAFIAAAAARSQVAFYPDTVVCTLELSRRLDPGRVLSHRLIDVCQRHGIVHDRPHDALCDALATAAVLPHLLAQHHIVRLEDLAPFTVSVPVSTPR
jgi:DNA polymerase III alpha subunit (gram-positive type)